MIDERPDALLKSALEKIVYFEARSEQLTNDGERFRLEAERLRTELAQAAQREIELRRLVAELEVRVQRAHSEREETARVAESLRRERAELVGKMLDASRIHSGGELAPDAIDLASFISELRSQVLSSPVPPPVAAPSAPRAPAALAARPVGRDASPNDSAFERQSVAVGEPVPAPVASAPAKSTQSPLARMASELSAQGRFAVSAVQLGDLAQGQAFAGHTEETLFGFSVRELSAPDASARQRAADRLKALGHAAAAPALATALHAEHDERVLVSLLNAFACFAKAEGVPVVAPLLTATSPDVRIAALKALLALDPAGAGPHLTAAVKDPDRSVRRRASLLALSVTGGEALRLGEQSIRDEDPEVRALASLVLGACGAAEAARPMLLAAMRDRELKVRKAAAQSLSRLLGHDVTSVVTLEDAQRRREVRRLATLKAAPVLARRGANDSGTGTRAGTPLTATVTDNGNAFVPGTRERARDAGTKALPLSVPVPVPAPVPGSLHSTAAPKLQAAVAVLEVPPALDAALASALVAELRTAIRGRQLGELAAAAKVTVEQVAAACAALEAKGAVVRRGGKYFVA